MLDDTLVILGKLSELLRLEDVGREVSLVSVFEEGEEVLASGLEPVPLVHLLVGAVDSWVDQNYVVIKDPQ